jgi:dihydrofolate synthase/folylpolyglutamate synthase
VIAAECARQGTALWRVTPAGGDGEVRVCGEGDELSILTPACTYEGLRLAMLGRHQRLNAACAVAAIDALAEQAVAHVPPEAVAAGLASVRVPGRLERVADDPVTVLDGAHNADAARALAAALPELFSGQRPILLLGILGDKDVAAMVAALAPLAAAVVVTEPPWAGRTGKAGEVARAARDYVDEVALDEDVARALALAQRRARELGAPLVVAGSLILVGEVRRLLMGVS